MTNDQAVRTGLDGLRQQLKLVLPEDRFPLRRRWQQLMRSRYPADPGQVQQLQQRIAASSAALIARQEHQPRLELPEELPISQQRDALLADLQQHRVLVVTGETGSGKTTQLPKLCWQAGRGRDGMIGLTQPRRLAAMIIADRLREELAVGEEVVAHAVRFADKRQPSTAIGVLTDGLLLAEASRDRRFQRYDCLIIDEAHERSVTIDLLLALVRQVLRQRDDLQVVITSASIDAQRFADYFSEGLGRPVPIRHVSGRQYPVTIEYRDPGDDELGYLDASIRLIRELPAEGEQGDVLCFLPTERDILEARRRLRDLPGSTVLPLFGRLSPHEQRTIFQPQRGRKVVLATNIAETSVTVPGIRVVVDAGLARMKRYQAHSRTERLPVEPISQASCLQRSGRAGRIAPGRCIRLYSERDFDTRSAFTDPEILRSNLAGVMLQVVGLGLGDAASLDWLDPPRSGAWQQARQLLLELGAIEQRQRGVVPTAAGCRMAQLPCDPGIARMLLVGATSGVADAIATIAAFCSVQDPRLRPVGEEGKADQAQSVFRQESGDLATVLRLWQTYQAHPSTAAQGRFCKQHMLGFRRMREWADVRHQFLVLLREQRLSRRAHPDDAVDLDQVHRSVLAGCLGNVLHYDPEQRCYRSGERQLQLHPGSSLVPRNRQERNQSGQRCPWLLAVEVVETSRLFARLCAPIDPAWVVELAGSLCKRRYGDPFYHGRRGQVVCEERVFWRGLLVQERRLVSAADIDATQAHAVFLREALAQAQIRARVPAIRQNRRLLQRIQGLSDRLRDRSLWCDEQALAEVYGRRLARTGIADDRALQRWLRRQGKGCLHLDPVELVDPQLWQRAEHGYPEQVQLAGRMVPVHYRYAPGDTEDGARIDLRADELERIDPEALERLIPGWLEEQVLLLLKRLPKDQRRRLIPLGDSATRLAARLSQTDRPLCRGLGQLLAEEYGLQPGFQPDVLPDHLRPLVVVQGDAGELARGRDLSLLGGGRRHDPLAALRSQVETGPLVTWPADLPDRIDELGRRAWCGLLRCRAADASTTAKVQLFRYRSGRDRWHSDGVAALLESVLAADLERFAQAGSGRVRVAEAAFDKQGMQRLPALRRALLLAKWHDRDLDGCRDADTFQQLSEACRQGLASDCEAIDRLLAAIADELGQLQRRLRAPVKHLGAAGLQAVLTADSKRLLQGGWCLRLPWRSLERIPVYLAAVRLTMDLSAAQLPRVRESRDSVAAELAALARQCDWRLLQSLGLTALWRQANEQVEEVALAAVGRPVPARREAHPMTCRQRLRAVQQALDEQRQMVETEREPLLRIRPFLQRADQGPVRDRLLADVDEQLRRYPAYELGADLEQQAEDLRACLAAARRFLDVG